MNPSKAAAALGKLGGKVKSEAKTTAARKNGKLGGRPKKPIKRLSSTLIPVPWPSHAS